MLKKLIIFMPMTLMLYGSFVMKDGEPLKKVTNNNKPTVSQTNHPTIQKGGIDGAISELFYSNESGVNDGKDGVNNVGKYNKDIRLTFTEKQKYVAMGLTNIFEFSHVEETKEHGYKSCAVTDEAHGITAGKVGVTSATISMYNFFKDYYNKPPFTKYLPELKRLKELYGKKNYVISDGEIHDYHSPSYVDGLKGLCDNWHTISANNPEFIRAQNKYVQDKRYLPAVRAAEKYNVHLPITLAAFYDTQVLQGNIDIVAKELGRFKGKTAEEEIAWLKWFNAVRARIIEKEGYWGRRVSIRPKSLDKLIEKGKKDPNIWWLDIEKFTVYYETGSSQEHEFKRKF